MLSRNRASDQILDRRALVEGRKRSYHYRMTAITQEGKVGGMTPERKVMQLKSLDELADQLQTQDPGT